MKGVDDGYFFTLEKNSANLYELSKFIKFCAASKIQEPISSPENSTKFLNLFTSVNKPIVNQKFSDPLFIPFSPTVANKKPVLLNSVVPPQAIPKTPSVKILKVPSTVSPKPHIPLNSVVPSQSIPKTP